MKKAVFIVMSLIFILSFMTSAYAEGINIGVPESTAAEAGGMVVVNINISGNTGIGLGKVRLDFDKNVLTPISVDKGSILSGAWYFQTNIDDPGLDSSELDFVTVSWMNAAALTGDGTLAAVTFAAADGVSGNSEFKVTVEELTNGLTQDITASVANGVIEFGGGSGDSGNNSGDEIDVALAENSMNKTATAINGSMNLNVYSPKTETASFIFSIYDSNGNLAAVRIKNTTLTEGVNNITLDSINAPVTNSGKYTAKVYTWNNLNDMVPLTDIPVTVTMQ